jgi:hypothetical protein
MTALWRKAFEAALDANLVEFFAVSDASIFFS